MKINNIAVLCISVMFLAIACGGPLGGGAAAAGIAKTTNGGVDWALANNVFTGEFGRGRNRNVPETDDRLLDTDVHKLLFEGANRERLYAATRPGGVFYSENSGEVWSEILPKVSAYDIAIDPGNTDHIYVAGIVAGNGKVLESKDKGKSWEEIFNEVSRQNPVRAIAINPASANEIVIGLNSGNLIKSTDAGRSWTLLQNFQDPVVQITWQVSGLYVLASARGLYRSTNGGVDFTNLSGALLSFTAASSSARPEDTQLTNITQPSGPPREFNQFSVGLRDTSHIYIAADNGLYKTTDGGTAWNFVKLPLKNNTSAPVEISAVSFGGTDSTVYAGAGNTVYKSLNSGESWQVQSIATNAFIQYILVDPNVSQVAYVGLNGSH